MPEDEEVTKHQLWLELLQPVGLLVSPHILKKAQMHVNRDIIPLQNKLKNLTLKIVISHQKKPYYNYRYDRDLQIEAYATPYKKYIESFSTFVTEILGWSERNIDNNPETLSKYDVQLDTYDKTITCDYVVTHPLDGNTMMLVKVLPTAIDMDTADKNALKYNRWYCSEADKLDKLLTTNDISTGLLFNGTSIRLMYAPKGEAIAYIDFIVDVMCTPDGRLMLGVLEMLLGKYRVFGAPSHQRLVEVLKDSRKYRSEVSIKLAQQVLESLWELLRGFAIANQHSHNRLLGSFELYNFASVTDGVILRENNQLTSDKTLLKKENAQHIYGGLVAVLMRTCFMLYAEDCQLMPVDDIYTNNYGVTGLHEKLSQLMSQGHNMRDRYEAYSHLLSLFRIIHQGAGKLPQYLIPREGELFDTDKYPFLEGRNYQNPDDEDFNLPLISDEVMYKVLNGLVMLEGEKLYYQSLDVEEIGSVYQFIMGYEVQRASVPMLGLNGKVTGGKNSITIVVSIQDILNVKPYQRNKFLKELTGIDLNGKFAEQLKQADSYEMIMNALSKKLSPFTPDIITPGSLYLQPTEERRRSGSHYTPRSMSESMVRETLKPLLKENRTEEDILNLKVCDIAMGSGAFLVAACRVLAEKLVEIWGVRDDEPNEQIQAKLRGVAFLKALRLVAQRCLYGVDRNPFAVILAKKSLWLLTLSSDLPFTFVDHSLKCGDSLIGLSQEQVKKFINLSRLMDKPLFGLLMNKLCQAKGYRDEIVGLKDEDYCAKSLTYGLVEEELSEARLSADAAVTGFFSQSNGKKKKQDSRESVIKDNLFSALSIRPFHWHLEFPEVFDRDNPGFDVIVGNPPFMGGGKISSNNGDRYLAWLLKHYPDSGGQTDLVAYFFRRSFELLRNDGAMGLIATNTISQGDTRSAGLRWICNNGGVIYNAITRHKWEGMASVIVSIVYIYKGDYHGIKLLDAKRVDFISAFLFNGGSNDNPALLVENESKSFVGSILLGMGFTFDDSNSEATPIAQMYNLIANNSKNAELIFPYIGGDEVNTSPTHSHHRYAINFGEMTEDDATKYPDLMNIVQNKVKPQRNLLPIKNSTNKTLAAKWWLYSNSAKQLYHNIANLNRVLVIPRVSKHLCVTFLPGGMVYSDMLIVVPVPTMSAFATLQSNVHQIWAWFFSSTMKDDLRYSHTDCFQTFPFPINWEHNHVLEAIGKEYYEYRASLMIANNQGLTATYNRFHQPEDTLDDIQKLRELQQQMDRAVLDVYGWDDVQPVYDFILEYQVEEMEEVEMVKRKSRRKPYRYRWGKETHNQVLGKLLTLNRQRHEETTFKSKKLI